MLFVIGLIVGLIIGWIVEWIIDYLFWRTEVEHDAVEQVVDAAPAIELADMRLVNELDALRQENLELRRQLQSISAVQAVPPSTPDNLTRVNGIGKVYQSKLNDAGIYTFGELANLTSEQLEEIIAPQEWQAVDFAGWRIQAKSFAGLDGDATGDTESGGN